MVKPAWTLPLASSIKSHQHTSNTSGKQLSCIAKTMLQDASRDTRTKAKPNLRSGMATMSPNSQVHSPAEEPQGAQDMQRSGCPSTGERKQVGFHLSCSSPRSTHHQAHFLFKPLLPALHPRFRSFLTKYSSLETLGLYHCGWTHVFFFNKLGHILIYTSWVSQNWRMKSLNPLS